MFRTAVVPPPPGYPNATPAVQCVIYAAGCMWAGVRDTSGFSGAWLQAFSTTTLQPVGSPISLGSGVAPIEMAYDSVNGNLWVTGFSTSTVGIVSLSAQSMVATISAQSVTNPEGIMFDGARRMYVANYLESDPGTISVFETSSPFSLVQRINVGANPDWLAFDGTFLWVTNAASSSDYPSVMLLNPAAGAIVDTVPLAVGSLPLSIVYDGTANMYVGYGGPMNAVAKIDVASRSIVGIFSVPGSGNANIRGLMYQPGMGVESIWTCNSFFDSVSRLDASTGAVLATYPTGTDSQPRVLAFDGVNAWIANTEANYLTVVRPAENSLLEPLYGLSL